MGRPGSASSALGAMGTAILALCAAAPPKSLARAASAAAGPPYVGNEACRSCHEEIYDGYSRTAMARTSGPARPNLIEGAFRHEQSGVEYRVLAEGEKAYLAYERPGDPGLRGRQELAYHVGSNTRGRTFLFQIEGLLYKSPINFYTETKGWDMSPGNHPLREMELKPAPRNCLFCHASRIQPASGAPNRYGSAPFLQDGVGCERCHGPGGEHVQGRGAMVDPALLTGGRRDSVCIQCHLLGDANVRRPGKTIEMYRPGDLLSDYVATFVYDGAGRGALGAVSQVEALAQSQCMRRSGDRMACITCHDPHTVVPAAERVAYYRDKCLSCHERPFADRHQQGSLDCIGCHMPRRRSADLPHAHTQVTDHRILRRAGKPPARPLAPGPRRLVPFGAAQADSRELGLAYAEVALEGDVYASQEALRLLPQALPRYPRDVEVLTGLGFLYHQLERNGPAAEMYERALQADTPAPESAATNLGVIYASKGDLGKALVLWKGVFGENPGLSEVGVNLAVGLCQAGDTAKARETLVEVLRYQPDLARARAMLRELESAPERCPGPNRPRAR
jgi:tetratricopeptide repeat protein/cytochrome c554/c'-like protein